MNVEEEIRGSVAVVSPQGKIFNVAPLIENTDPDIGVYRRMKEAVERLVKSGMANIILDLGGVTAVDSGGLGGIVSLRSMIGKNEGRLILCTLTPEVESIFQLTELIDFFEVLPSREEALALFPE
jgi:anti-anti-sigma factor